MAEDLAVIWAAGLFEGEGYIRRVKPDNWRPELQLAMTDYDVVARFAEAIDHDTSRISCHTCRPDTQPQYRLFVTGKAAVRRVLNLLLPYFGNRRSYDAQNVLDALDGI